jgi:hypothetical protein
MEEATHIVSVYVIMPFTETKSDRDESYWDQHFEHFIKGKINDTKGELEDYFIDVEDIEFNISRSSVQKGGPLNYEIVWDLLISDIVVADITDLNPNVLYELGVRHALTASVGQNRTILIQNEDEWNLPFDFSNYSVIPYNKSKPKDWEKNIKERIKDCIENKMYRDNPVSMTFAQRDISFSLGQESSDVEQINVLMEMIDRMVNDFGFDKDWVQDFLTAAFMSENPDLADSLRGVSFGEDTLVDGS